jgi:hypothetical protein
MITSSILLLWCSTIAVVLGVITMLEVRQVKRQRRR